MINSSNTRILVLLIAMVAVTETLRAAQINGQMNFNGSVTLNTTSAGTANRVTGWFGPNGNPNIAGATGDFAAFVTPGTSTAAFQAPWFFSSPGGVPAFWTTGGFTFNLTESHVTFQTSSAVTVSGSGIITGNGYDPTPGTWSFTTQNPPASGRFSFSASTRAIPCTGTIGDFVWQDTNGNGIQDPNEPGINGVTVVLTDNNDNVLQTTITGPNPSVPGANGYYQFSGLCAGTYKVRIDNSQAALTGYVPTQTNAPGSMVTNDSNPNPSTVIFLTNNSSDQTIDFGYVACAGRIGDFVWQDNDGDGCQDPSEPGIAGVQVDLYQECVFPGGQPFRTTNTDGDGKYVFDGLCPGTYTVSFHTPAGYVHTLTNQSCNINGRPADETDSDCACQGTGPCGVCVTLAAYNSEDTTIDCGYVPECDLSVTKGCSVTPAPPSFDCAGAKPILSMKERWNGATSPIWVRAWNGTINGKGVAQSTFGPVTTGQIVTFTRTSASTPNDIYFEIFTCSAMTSACKLGNSTFHLSCSDVDMNGPEDCGKAEGNGKTTTTSYINDWIFEGMAGASQGFNCSTMPPPPSGECSVPAGPTPSCANSGGRPTSLKFKYTSGGCAASNNQQPYGTKFECDEPGTAPNKFDWNLPIVVGQNDQVGSLRGSQSYTIINNANGQPVSSGNPVLPGGTFTVSSGSSTFNTESYFALINQGGGGTEYVDIHTSCSQPLAVGDVFGSMTLVAFNGQSGGSSITYDYNVTNNGPFTLNNVYLKDNRLGPIAGPFSLQGFETKSFSAQAQINDTTDNVATAYVDDGQGPTCQTMSNEVTVNVTASCPIWSNNASISSKQLKRSLYNPGSTTVTITGLHLEWPAANGKLLDVKLDADVVWNAQSPAGATSIDIPNSALTTTSSKKSINPGQTRVFTLDFQNTAAAMPYVVSISFGSRCTQGFTIGGGCDVPGNCTPPYPFASSNPLTSIPFNESEVLRSARLSVDANCVPRALQVFYNDEHALTLGIRQVNVKTSSGTTTTNYPVSPLATNPGSAMPPAVGSTFSSGDQAGTDVSDRPMFPALFITDVTANPGNPTAGDWQYGGTAIPPTAVFGTWKAAVRTVDKTRNPVLVTVTPDADPATNHYNLGPGSDPVPPGLVDQGYGAEVRWDFSSLGLISGHQYRLYFMVHDGDQNKTGGDVGQACATFTMP